MRLTAPSRREWAVFALFLAIFSAVYLPALRAEYGVEDDYVDFAAEVPNLPESLTDEFDREISPGRAWRRSVAEGRPLNALAQYLTHLMVSELEHLRYVRFVGILGIALLAWSLYRALAGAGHHRLGAFCVAAVACSALPFQVWVYWASTATLPLAAALSGFAFLLAERASPPTPPHTHTGTPNASGGRRQGPASPCWRRSPYISPPPCSTGSSPQRCCRPRIGLPATCSANSDGTAR